MGEGSQKGAVGTVKATANTSSEHESRREAELILLSFLPGEGSEKRPKTRSTQLP